jgi:hypothetical protein
MRKVFWGSTACAVLVVVGVVATANHAARCPHSVIGRVLHGASYLAARMSPAASVAQVLAHTDCTAPDVIGRVDGIPDDPEAAPEQTPAATDDAPMVNEERSSAPIVIPEDDRSQMASVHLPMPSAEGASAPFGAQTECPPAAARPGAPATMPPCRDEEECEPLPMPAEGDKGCEALPLPSAEEESETGVEVMPEAMETFFQMLMRQFNDSSAKHKEPGECSEGPSRQHHYSACPYTGRPYPGCPTSGACPSKPCPPPSAAPGGEEASEPASKKSSALRKVHRLNTRHPLDETCPVHPEVDTMEYRPSDGSLHDYGPGAL